MWLTLAPTNMVKGSLIPRIPEPWLLLELVHFRKWIWSSQQDILNWLVCKLSSSDLKILRTRARLDNYLSIVIKITLNRQFKFCLHMYHLNVSSHGQVSVWYSSYHGAHVFLQHFDHIHKLKRKSHNIICASKHYFCMNFNKFSSIENQRDSWVVPWFYFLPVSPMPTKHLGDLWKDISGKLQCPFCCYSIPGARWPSAVVDDFENPLS